MKIAIFGSCVSRDTAEFIPDASVLAYVARHSVTSLERPHGTMGVDISGLSSAFQKRMVTSDLRGNGIERITKEAEDLDLVLIDLVDERRGYWQFRDGTTMTNSLELESCGAVRDVRRQGARLVEFGTDEHFENWQTGFAALIDGLKTAKLWNRSILLDIEWAGAVDGAQHPRDDSFSRIGRRWRRLQRRSRDAARGLSRGRGIGDAWTSLRTVKPTEAEEFADRAAVANADYVRYRKSARTVSAAAVSRRSSEVRIDREHKWGPQPFHFRASDYQSIVESVLGLYAEQGGERS
ncbi:hypothetical protein SAMN04489751_1316 [Brevibacterium sandarakinum]|uniref:Uncharacterized protein n=1 Tax=Brevibacterium sandarakinum TaxID=629680 RepID=A0A1H1PRK9_BRESA|nr:DUF6270 domain-containing protein [Brevibacterium sandarakinum]SDS13794.1 hypothetical protein SAMN04489751_1316 [Brevibacterium sandarakinum]